MQARQCWMLDEEYAADNTLLKKRREERGDQFREFVQHKFALIHDSFFFCMLCSSIRGFKTNNLS
jgi:hypothetical protein